MVSELLGLPAETHAVAYAYPSASASTRQHSKAFDKGLASFGDDALALIEFGALVLLDAAGRCVGCAVFESELSQPSTRSGGDAHSGDVLFSIAACRTE
jgi:hypothetical protein